MSARVRFLSGVYAILFLYVFAFGTVEAAPFSQTLLKRQVGTAGSDTDSNSDGNGGAGSAAHAAQAAGNSIDTGAGGDRSTPSTQFEFARLLSGPFFGCLIGLLLGGAFFVQCWTYLEKFGRRGADARPIQYLVWMLLCFSLLSDSVLIHRIYSIHVRNFGDFAFPLLTIGWELTVDYICIAFMATGVQLYFAHRVWTAFGRPLWLAIPFGILIGFTFCGGITSGVLSYQAGSAANVRGSALQSFQPDSTPWQWSVVFATWLISSTVIDVGLCALLFVHLSRMKSPFFSTRHAVARLLTLSIETCLLTVGFSLCAMILFLTSPENFFYLIPFAPIGQVYGSSCVATLMKRTSIARELAQDQTQGPQNRNIDAFASQAPPSIAKPVLKRIMKREEAKRPLEVQMTTVVQQVASTDETYGFGMSKMDEKDSGSDVRSEHSAPEYRGPDHMHVQPTHMPFSNDLAAHEVAHGGIGSSPAHGLPSESLSHSPHAQGSDALQSQIAFELVNGSAQMPGLSHPFGASYESSRPGNSTKRKAASTARSITPKKTSFALPEDRNQTWSPAPTLPGSSSGANGARSPLGRPML